VLTADSRNEILAELAHSETNRMACIEALKIAQRENGWVSDGQLREVADLLEMTPDEVDGVATFYNLIRRRPVGRHVILLCASVSCWVMGYAILRARVKQTLGIEPGQTTADGRFTILENQCLGACDHAPVLMINDDLYRDVDPEQLGDILAKYA
jgi:NADH-quinone oxidoreductase subunit E